MEGCCSRCHFEQKDETNKYRFIDGGQYHNFSDSMYFLANDDEAAYHLSRYHDDMAQQYPNSKFVGIDITPIQPTEVHEQFMFAAFTEIQWKEKVIPEMIRLAQPDGRIEILEADCGESGMNPMIGKEIPHSFENTNAFSEIKTQQKTINLSKKYGESSEDDIVPESHDALVETVSIEAEKHPTYF
ncbi:11175_t:CDS:2 [Ambispora leptoticha]|uniref:11175_t:CDS:1 n=1 Tax=Ambispora leptoticha TaxID=144679 RepID=A0A9N9G4I6_9GLOM|nr:11175_t:CDS:2 [Ambispora leptoticha]